MRCKGGKRGNGSACFVHMAPLDNALQQLSCRRQCLSCACNSLVSVTCAIMQASCAAWWWMSCTWCPTQTEASAWR